MLTPLCTDAQDDRSALRSPPRATPSPDGERASHAPRWIIDMMVTQAIANAVDSRTRAAVMLIGVEPACTCRVSSSWCWHQHLPPMLERIAQHGREWAPVQFDDRRLLVVGSDFGSSGEVIERARALRAAVARLCRVCDHETAPDCAVGIGMFPEDGDTAQELLRRAEEALADLRLFHLGAVGFCLRPHAHGSGRAAAAT